MDIEIKVLGPLEVSVGGVSIVPTANKPSQLLAMLAINAGHVVTVNALTEEIWDYRPPRSGVPTLHTYILKLRRKLQQALAGQPGVSSKDILLTRRSGYVLDVEPDIVDAVRYDRLSAAGRAAVNEGDSETASRMLGEALELWRGPAFVDVPAGPQLAIESMRLEENRLSDLHLRIAADLRLGRHYQLLGELATLCARHPLLENFCAQHMMALYRSGRQSQALEAYRRLRASMVEQLGVEPSARVRRLHNAILTGHAAMDDPKFVYSA
ncbi:MAG TPA: AfsR/SARP family transcriptional regulator [Actinophytocola sp.]|jgi:DNA-binding SARP family transcriptional activator|uniref:AfsR/SARP family transcriptional regulator n=1 Tax=Actinophytocola sp. TaxID=1872138 RepID=UPI002F9286EB